MPSGIRGGASDRTHTVLGPCGDATGASAPRVASKGPGTNGSQASEDSLRRVLRTGGAGDSRAPNRVGVSQGSCPSPAERTGESPRSRRSPREHRARPALQHAWGSNGFPAGKPLRWGRYQVIGSASAGSTDGERANHERGGWSGEHASDGVVTGPPSSGGKSSEGSVVREEGRVSAVTSAVGLKPGKPHGR